MDANSWAKREVRYRKKFQAGQKYIPALFRGFTLPPKIDQIALFGLSGAGRQELSGGRVLHIKEFMSQVTQHLRGRRIASAAVPESFPLLRAIQLTLEHASVG